MAAICVVRKIKLRFPLGTYTSLKLSIVYGIENLVP